MKYKLCDEMYCHAGGSACLALIAAKENSRCNFYDAPVRVGDNSITLVYMRVDECKKEFPKGFSLVVD